MNALTGTAAAETALASVASAAPARRRWWVGGAASLAWLVLAAVTYFPEDADDYARTGLLAVLAAGVGAAIGLAALAGVQRRSRGFRSLGQWLLFLPLVLIAWELLTAKFNLLPRPFFAAPQEVLEVYTDDWKRLGDSLVHSLALLGTGYAIGASSGFVLGVAMGWSRAVSYWAHPVLRLVGPLPPVAWLPLAFFALPSSWDASVCLIALATGFPVTVLTWSGVANVSSAYYDVARTLGAGTRFLVLRVAIPAALPSVFVGLFMGMGASFAMLVVAEMMGVKSGLGWYLTWAQGWAAYGNMYAALLVMALMCSGLITLLFRVRDHALAWQKSLLRW
jgi:NitT/TauT family transport system permease protein